MSLLHVFETPNCQCTEQVTGRIGPALEWLGASLVEFEAFVRHQSSSLSEHSRPELVYWFLRLRVHMQGRVVFRAD